MHYTITLGHQRRMISLLPSIDIYWHQIGTHGIMLSWLVWYIEFDFS